MPLYGPGVCNRNTRFRAGRSGIPAVPVPWTLLYAQRRGGMVSCRLASLPKSSGPSGWGRKVDKVVLAPLRHVYCAPYQGYVGSDGMPVVGGDGEHGNGLAKQVLLELDALAAGQVMSRS